MGSVFERMRLVEDGRKTASSWKMTALRGQVMQRQCLSKIVTTCDLATNDMLNVMMDATHGVGFE
jgi:hypothetical protein